MSFKFSIPTDQKEKNIELSKGSSLIFVGANGSGKTRLAVYIEQVLEFQAHRISAHRALTLNPDVQKINERRARMGLRTGNTGEDARISYRQSHRWRSNGAVALLNDFDFLIQVLFAEQTNTALKAYQSSKQQYSNPKANESNSQFQLTKFDRLKEVWESVLPDRQLCISGDDIQVSLRDSNPTYKASDMSDGERAIFYLIGQVLVAEEESVLIVDEPELHVHRSIMSKLWDELEAIRPDCAFVFITHDLEFAVARTAQKWVIKDYSPTPHWTIEDVPEDTGFDEELVTLILGSRSPILFVEGAHGSLDMAIYRRCYPEWTVIPRGSCSEVIHSVVTMRKNADLTRVTCSGIVDADDYDDEDKKYLAKRGIKVLPVSEIENVIALPDVSRAIAEAEGYENPELKKVLNQLSEAIFETINSPEKIEKVVVRYCKRRIDRILKKVDLSGAETIDELEKNYRSQAKALNIRSITNPATKQIKQAIKEQNLPKLLSYYDYKRIIALVASKLKKCRKRDFESWLTRILRNNSVSSVSEAIRSQLPKIQPK